MTEKELDKACEWIANMPIEYSEFIEKGHCRWIADDFRKAMTESERQVTIDGKRYKVKKLYPEYRQCEKCVFGMLCGTNQIETPPCIVHNLDKSEYFESAE